ncbi:hypothetical protein TWF106_009694 [Orbilia oligospora]|uniref:Methyltransferase type 11 domain-containing protein n=1 Tax=Orbilia oligospora TaxID=2813651 RepID=A0A7C8QHL4_ORBOL|nr:hypothetical protein TWF679_011256 [Orbilia oligospora]KAF3212836.1 hypothetical protein TWF106_009694 [Orbilia oligospora]
MSNIYSPEAPASTSQIPMYSGTGQSFAERARAKKAAMEARSQVAPPPGLAAPSNTTAAARGRSRVPSPNFYAVPDNRRHGGPKILLPVAPSLTPSSSIASPTSDPRTPSPPPTSRSPFYQLPNLGSNSSKSTMHEGSSHSKPTSKTPSSTANSSSTVVAATEKRPQNMIRKKTNAQTTDSKMAMRTGSTTSTNASSASFTTSTSASHMGGGYGQNSLVFGISMPPTSYTYGSRTHTTTGTRQNPRTIAPPPGLSTTPSASIMQRTRSGSGSQSSATSTRLSVSGIDSQLASPKAGVIPPPLTIPAAVAENYNSSPSTENCGSPGMFSHNSTPTSSSTNPSLFQSPGFSPPVISARNSSPVRPLISKYAGVAAATDKLGKAIAMKKKDSEGNTPEGPKQTKTSSRNSMIPTNSAIVSLTAPKTRDTKTSEATKLVQPTKHFRKTSKDLFPSKSSLSVGFAGFHIRKSSKDLTSTSASSSQVGRPPHSRQSSRDSSNIRSPGEGAATAASYFPSTSPIPIPVPSSSTTSLRLPPSRPSRDGAPDDLGGFGSDVPVIQSGIVATKDSKTKGQKMKIITSSSLPYRSGATFGTVNGSTSSVNLTSTSVPGQSKSMRSPTPTSAKATNIVHGFTFSTSSPATSSQPTKGTGSSPRKLKKEDKKNSSDKNTLATAPPPSRPSLFSRGRTKTIPPPAASADKEKPPSQRRLLGPSAGTGHEGYPQFNKPVRNRSSSSGSIPTAPAKAQAAVSTPPGSWGRAAGAAALKNAPIDSFLALRLEPVVMKGGAIKPSGGIEMVKTGSSQSTSSFLQRPSTKNESQKSSLDLPRAESSQGPNSRDHSVDIPRKITNDFAGFDFGPDVIAQKHLPATIDTSSHSRPSTESPISAILSPTTKIGLSKTSKSTPSIRDEEKETKLKQSKRLIPPAVGTTSQPARRWRIFSKIQSAPGLVSTSDVPKDTSKLKVVTPKPASQSLLSRQEAKVGDANTGGYIRGVHSQHETIHSPPIRNQNHEIPRLVAPQNPRESILLPDRPVMPRLVAPRTPSPVISVTAPPGLPAPQKTSNGGPSTVGLTRPPPGLPIPAELRPVIFAKSTTPTQPSKLGNSSETLNMSPVSALTTSPSSITKSTSSKTSTRPSPANLPVRNVIQEAVEKTQKLSDVSHDDDDSYDSNEYTDEEDYIDDEREEDRAKENAVPPVSAGFVSVISPPVTPKSVTPEPATSPSQGPRRRLDDFALGRIPKAGNVEGSSIRLPTLAEILPPPPSLRARQQPSQPIMIHPPRRIAHHPVEQIQPASSEDEDEDDGGEGIDYINTRKIPLSRLAPLVTTGLSQFQVYNTTTPQRISNNTDDWSEYDDFIDEMSAATPRSKTPSLGAPFPEIVKFKPDLRDEIEPTRRLKDSPTLPSASTFGDVTKFAPSNKKKLVLDQGKLSQGRPVAARPFFSPTLPTARSSLFGGSIKELNSQRSSSTYSQRSSSNQKTIAFADFIAAYAEADRGVMSVIDPLDKAKCPPSQGRKVGVLSPMSSVTDFEDDSSTDSESYRESIISAMPGTEDALEGEMKVRLWALMTSRWLSFGRVLVSPAHEEIKLSPSGSANKRILVIDGLGNDDWSFYCSLNYPNATVYNLTPSPAIYPTSPAGDQPNPSNPTDNLNNHHQIHHVSFASPFPFPSGFFTVVTFRFLPCTSDALWPFIISQCMRVLKPGGYLELSVLDIDMVNMGPRTKRTVDEIKVNLRKHQSGNGSDWHKKTPSEKALRLMAKRGFTDITRCRVGLPTVGNVDGSREEQASMQQILKEGNSPEEVDMGSAEGINRVVSKVGRWWYGKCFENIGEEVQGETLRYKKTLWEDKTLLRECEKKKTNFRMLISFARKPTS